MSKQSGREPDPGRCLSEQVGVKGGGRYTMSKQSRDRHGPDPGRCLSEQVGVKAPGTANSTTFEPAHISVVDTALYGQPPAPPLPRLGRLRGVSSWDGMR
jgi:hypothetical protein